MQITALKAIYILGRRINMKEKNVAAKTNLIV